MAQDHRPTVALISLGCPKNLVDAERMLAALALDGFLVTDEPDGADLAVVNTCAFIDLARAEADQHLDALESLKAAGRLGRIVVAGCLAQRAAAEVARRHPGVDAIVGLADRDALPRLCRGALARGPGDAPIVRVGPHAPAAPDDAERLRLTPRHYAYLRISEGCDNRCAYCAIPAIRGPLRSKPADRVLAEARELAADGARELILIGQDTTAYGRDLAGGWGLARLLGELRGAVPVDWLRVLYTHPASFTDDVIAELARGLPVVPYVDLPLQHADDAILASMGRRTTRGDIERLIARLREAVPGVALRTSFIVGYPGETDAAFERLVAFVRKVRFDHVGVFVYSRESGTRATTLPDPVPPAVGRRRWDRLMKVAGSLARQAARRQVGRTLTVRVDGPASPGRSPAAPGRSPAHVQGRLAARHAGQAPDVDACVLLPAGSAEVGAKVEARVTAARGYDLVGEVVRLVPERGPDS
jgi:ribosomal protein S12 methylthiotransferase